MLFYCQCFQRGLHKQALTSATKPIYYHQIRGITQIPSHSLQPPSIKARHAVWWMLSPLMETLRGIYPSPLSSCFFFLFSPEWKLNKIKTVLCVFVRAFSFRRKTGTKYAQMNMLFFLKTSGKSDRCWDLIFCRSHLRRRRLDWAAAAQVETRWAEGENYKEQ